MLYFSPKPQCITAKNMSHINSNIFIQRNGGRIMQIQYDLIGNRIKVRREELHLKQCYVAKQLNISSNHMSAIENGREHPSLDILILLCDILKVTPDYLLLGCLHADNMPLNIIESLKLCQEDDIILIQKFIELLITRNKDNWNNLYFS